MKKELKQLHRLPNPNPIFSSEYNPNPSLQPQPHPQPFKKSIELATSRFVDPRLSPISKDISFLIDVCNKTVDGMLERRHGNQTAGVCSVSYCFPSVERQYNTIQSIDLRSPEFILPHCHLLLLLNVQKQNTKKNFFSKIRKSKTL